MVITKQMLPTVTMCTAKQLYNCNVTIQFHNCTQLRDAVELRDVTVVFTERFTEVSAVHCVSLSLSSCLAVMFQQIPVRCVEVEVLGSNVVVMFKVAAFHFILATILTPSQIDKKLATSAVVTSGS